MAFNWEIGGPTLQALSHSLVGSHKFFSVPEGTTHGHGQPEPWSDEIFPASAMLEIIHL